MYALYADVGMTAAVDLTDDKALYAPSLPPEEFPIGSAVLTEGLNTINTLVFTIPPTNTNYDLVQLMNWIALIRVNDDGTVEDVFRGRIINMVDTLEGTLTVTCESALALLRDAVCMFDYQGDSDTKFVFESLLTKACAVNGISAGTCDVVKTLGDDMTCGDNIWADVTTLFSTYGGYVTTRISGGKVVVDWKQSSGPTVSETIEIGKNLVEFSAELDGSGFHTAVIANAPREGTEFGPMTWSNLALEKKYGTIYKKKEFPDGLTRMQIGTKLVAAANNLPGPRTTLTVKAIQLDHIKVGSYVPVYRHVSTDHQSYQLSEKVTDIMNPANSTFTLGRRTKRLTEF